MHSESLAWILLSATCHIDRVTASVMPAVDLPTSVMQPSLCLEAAIPRQAQQRTRPGKGPDRQGSARAPDRQQAREVNR
jgi:hypothetical protein